MKYIPYLAGFPLFKGSKESIATTLSCVWTCWMGEGLYDKAAAWNDEREPRSLWKWVLEFPVTKPSWKWKWWVRAFLDMFVCGDFAWKQGWDHPDIINRVLPACDHNIAAPDLIGPIASRTYHFIFALWRFILSCLAALQTLAGSISFIRLAILRGLAATLDGRVCISFWNQ